MILPPELFALGFAAYLYFMKAVKESNGKFYGELNGQQYLIQDDVAATFMKRWKTANTKDVVNATLKDAAFWGEDLTLLNGFEDSVYSKLEMIMSQGIKQAIETVQSKKVYAE